MLIPLSHLFVEWVAHSPTCKLISSLRFTSGVILSRIAAVMISRLMLNLRSPSLTRRKFTTSTDTAVLQTTDCPYVSTVMQDQPYDIDGDDQMSFPEPNSEISSRRDSGGTSGKLLSSPLNSWEATILISNYVHIGIELVSRTLSYGHEP
jgi:hypothetical protein